MKQVRQTENKAGPPPLFLHHKIFVHFGGQRPGALRQDWRRRCEWQGSLERSLERGLSRWPPWLLIDPRLLPNPWNSQKASLRAPSLSQRPRVPVSPAGSPPLDTATPAAPSTQLVRAWAAAWKSAAPPQNPGWGRRGGGKLQSCSCSMLKTNQSPLKARAAPLAPRSYARSTVTARSARPRGPCSQTSAGRISSQASAQRGCGSSLLRPPSSPTTQRCEKLVKNDVTCPYPLPPSCSHLTHTRVAWAASRGASRGVAVGRHAEASLPGRPLRLGFGPGKPARASFPRCRNPTARAPWARRRAPRRLPGKAAVR